MSAVLSVLANPAVDALGAQLIQQGLLYFQAMQERRAAGLMTEADVQEMASKLDVDFAALLDAREQQRQRESAAQQPQQVPDTSAPAPAPAPAATLDELRTEADQAGSGKAS